MYIYENQIEALADLKKRGFTIDFKAEKEIIRCNAAGIFLSPSSFEIVEYYRFEADTNPDDSSVLYAIQSIDGSIKGVLINAYGTYGDALSDDLIQKLDIHNH